MQGIVRIMFLSMIIMSTMTSCLKDSDEFVPYETYVETSILGVVLDDLNLPVENATVAFEGETTKTDSNGIFIFSDVVTSTSGAKIMTSGDDYFDVYRPIDPSADNRTVEIRLKSKGQTYSVPANSSRTINTINNTRIEFESGSMALNSGQPYNGNIMANFGYQDPLDPDVFSALAGGEKGINSNGDERLLEHFGTIWMSLESESGQDLILQDQKEITLHFPKPVDVVAPSEIPLWLLDESTGSWNEIGVAQLMDDHYEAKVKEIGTYSIQLGLEYSTLAGTVKDKNGQLLERARVAVVRETSGMYRRVWTDHNGRFEMDYPIRENLQIIIEDECQTELFRREEGPFLGRYELQTFEIETGDKYWRLSGIVTQCNQPTVGVVEGYSFIQTNHYRWITPVRQGGGFSTGLFLCGNQVIYTGRDLVNARSSGKPVVTISDPSGQGRASLGAAITCN